MALSVGFRITVSLLILLPKLRGSDSYPGGTVSHRTRQPSLDAQRPLRGSHSDISTTRSWPVSDRAADRRRLAWCHVSVCSAISRASPTGLRGSPCALGVFP